MAKKLPDPPKKLSALINLAVRDFAAAENNSRIVFNMLKFHRPVSEGKRCTQCQMCVAGCVMWKTLKTPHTALMFSHDFSENWKRALDAIDSVRAGSIEDAFIDLGMGLSRYDKRKIPSRKGVPAMPETLQERRALRRWMRDTAKVLRAQGL
jgi:hypothetical protein